MTTKLLRQVQAQDQAELAGRHNREARQPKNVWAPIALKPELTEQEWAAACRALQESGSLFRGRDGDMTIRFQIYRDRDTGMLTSGKEQSQLKQAAALRALYGLRQAVSCRCDFRKAANVAEMVVARWTLSGIAEGMGIFRFTGTPRRTVPDTRPIRPMVRLVLCAMADYYACCDLNIGPGRAA